MSTKRKQKSSHRNNHKGAHSRSHYGSLDHARTINKYLNRASLLENIAEGSSSYEGDPQFATMNHQLETMNSEHNFNYEQHIREQEMLMMLKEEEKRRNQIEELMNIEEKLERNYKYYEKIK